MSKNMYCSNLFFKVAKRDFAGLKGDFRRTYACVHTNVVLFNTHNRLLYM